MLISSHPAPRNETASFDERDLFDLLEALEREMQTAMRAIADGNLPALEGSLIQQAHLGSLLQAGRPDLLTAHEPSLQLRLQQACTSALQLNSTYATLVRQAQGTNTMLLALCAGYRQDLDAMGTATCAAKRDLLCTA